MDKNRLNSGNLEKVTKEEVDKAYEECIKKVPEYRELVKKYPHVIEKFIPLQFAVKTVGVNDEEVNCLLALIIANLSPGNMKDLLVKLKMFKKLEDILKGGDGGKNK